MPTSIECYKCDQCFKLLPKESSEFLMLHNIKVIAHEKIRSYEDKMWDRHILNIGASDNEMLFCCMECLQNYLSIKYKREDRFT